ncbi:hypothetical protein PMAYCL1PPCAC_08018, partial [Pristionchus mayeri]
VSLTQLLVFLLLRVGNAHKILVFNPTYSSSRVHFVATMVNALVEAGNEVHVIVPEVASNVKVVGSKAHRTIFVPSLKGNPLNSMLLHTDPLAPVDMRDAVFIQNMTIVAEEICADLIAGYDYWMELKREGGYDVGIAENFHAFGIMELLKVKQAILFVPGARSSAISRLIANIPAPPSIMPDAFFSSLSISPSLLSFPQRAFSLAASIATSQMLDMHLDREDALLRAHWPQLSPLRQSLSRIALILENTYPLLSPPQYRTHQIVPIGGLTVDSSLGEVDDEITRLLDETDGDTVVIYLSSIDTAKKLSRKLKDIIIDAISSLPNVTFLWRIDMESEGNHPPNLRTFSASMKTVLGHPRVRAVLCDMDATTYHEVSFSGVPLIALPLQGDQSHHTSAGISRGTTVLLDRDTVTARNVTMAINRALSDQSISTEATTLAKQLRRWPHRPSDTLVKHVDYVAEYGRPLGLEFAQVPLWAYYCLDILIPLLIVLLLLIYKIMRLWIGGYYQIFLKIKKNVEKKRALEGLSEEEEDEDEDPEEPHHRDSHSNHSHSHGGHGHSHEPADCDCWRHDPGVIELQRAMSGQQPVQQLQHRTQQQSLVREDAAKDLRKRKKQVSFDDGNG